MKFRRVAAAHPGSPGGELLVAPAVMALGAVLLAWTMYWVDGRIPDEALRIAASCSAGTPGELAQQLVKHRRHRPGHRRGGLHVADLAAFDSGGQYGSGLLRLFLGDRTTQLVLGMFVATFVIVSRSPLPFLREICRFKARN